MGKKTILFLDIYLIDKAFIPMFFFIGYIAVSYTHLTLPTSDLV